MGKAIEKVALSNQHSIACVLGRDDSLESLKDHNLDLVIEFTQPSSAFDNLSFCLKNNIPVITGTTGWLDRYEEIETLCRENDGTFLFASNFSIGVNLFFELNEWLAQKMSKLDFTPEITEIHHTEKKDSPSGTGLTLAEGVLAAMEDKTGWINEKSTDQTKLGIISQREPNVPGTHTVTYSSPLETIDITHTAHDRSVFAQGVVKVAEWIHTRKGVYTMRDFINDN